MLNKNLALVILVIFAAGCGLETRSYVMTKDRVGLDQINNGGCITGKCPPQIPKETTRKVYVLELTKPVPESEVQKIEATAVNAITEPVETPPTTNAAPAETAPADNAQAPAAVVVPVVGETPGNAPAAMADQNNGTAQENNGGNMQTGTYTVQKDDTLQKISKKLFGSYGKWYKIYEANKDKIKNPNILKPGTVLNIPVVK